MSTLGINSFVCGLFKSCLQLQNLLLLLLTSGLDPLFDFDRVLQLALQVTDFVVQALNYKLCIAGKQDKPNTRVSAFLNTQSP
ncbi:hypothetical protein COAQ111491_13795 [Comamonas aquatilis]